jgi:hypothetical protein
MDKGLILHPTILQDTFLTDIHVDADFAGGWGYEDSDDPTCVKSRTGFIIEKWDTLFNGCRNSKPISQHLPWRRNTLR